MKLNKELAEAFKLDKFKGWAKYKTIEIWWLDAQHGTSILYYEDLENLKPVLTRNIGYLIADKKTHIVLGYMLFDNDNVKHYQLIPKDMIVAYSELKGSMNK